MQTVLREAETRMQGAIDALTREFAGVRTGRASIALVEPIRVDYYGTPTPLNQAASLSVPDPKTILIQPWDPSLLPAFEKAILKSDLGLSPTNDGKVIRLVLPPLTEERRKQLARVVGKLAEEARVAIRNVRQDANKKLKGMEKDKKISEDDSRRAQDQVQKTTDKFTRR
ncbi:MAG: ribosome recycling factor, partial [Candidatus Methylomirabilia bacterium]